MFLLHVKIDFLIQYLRIQKQRSKGQLFAVGFVEGFFESYAIYYLIG